MSLELVGHVEEHFESRMLPSGIEILGEGRMRRLRIDFPGWLTPRPSEESIGIDLEHEAGVSARVRIRSGKRLRVEITVESDNDDLVTVLGPVMSVEGQEPAVSWLAGATGEIVLPSMEGPGMLTQRRGLATPAGELGWVFPLEAELTLRPRHALASAWTYEAFSGDLLDVPAEPSWLPWVRYVERGYAVEIIAPDGVVTVDDRTRLEEIDDEFEVYPPEGLVQVGVWGAGGQTRLEVGAYRSLSELREAALRSAPPSDVGCYVMLRQMLEGRIDERLLDRVDAMLGEYEQQPTAWSAVACQVASQLGLPLAAEAQRAATQVLSQGRVDDVLLLVMHQLVPLELATGGWPVGDFDRVGVAAVAALGYGRVSTDDRALKGRDVAVAKLFAAGLGETERGLHAAACAHGAEARLLSQLSTRPSIIDLAWLSIQ